MESNRDPAQFANRIEPIKQELEESNDPEDLMLMIMDALNDTVTPIPDVGKFYTWNELAGQLYIVEWNELDDLLAVPYAKYILNR
jgi:hypothetical protein